MKKITLTLLSLFLLFTSSSLSAFSKGVSNPILVQSAKHKHWCPVCGMSIKKFYKTSHTSKLANGENRQYCSMRCLAVDMKKNKINLNTVKVVDVQTDKLINAKSAIYVVDSDIRGTMTRVSKLAFSDDDYADDFNMNNGGYIVDFKTAFKMANDSLNSDIVMVSKKKQKKIYPMGKNIFEKKCKLSIEELQKYKQINYLKADLKNKQLCKPLKEKELQAVSLYLYEVRKDGLVKSIKGTIKVSKDEKCPICGMFIYKYPKWAAQIYYKNNHYSFDGVKDLMKYYFTHKDNISKILVTDYYSQKAIDARLAYYVTGSDVYGPMGDELIPFISEKEARTFSLDHKGHEVVSFNEITKELVKKLDE